MFQDNPFPEQVVVFCRGAADDEPTKPAVMSRVNGVPFLGHALASFKRNEITDVILVTREGGGAIETQYGDGSELGMRLRYFHDPDDEYGTGGALRAIENMLTPAFVTVIGDRYLALDYESLATAFVQEGLPVMMAVWENADAYHPSNCLIGDDTQGRRIVQRFHPERRNGMRHVNYGACVFRDDTVDRIPEGYSDLDGFHQGDALRRRIAAYEVQSRYYHVSTSQGLRELRSALMSGAAATYIDLL